MADVKRMTRLSPEGGTSAVTDVVKGPAWPTNTLSRPTGTRSTATPSVRPMDALADTIPGPFKLMLIVSTPAGTFCTEILVCGPAAAAGAYQSSFPTSGN